MCSSDLSELTFTGKVERSDHTLTGDTGSGGNATPVTLVAEHGDIEIRRPNAEDSERAEAPETPEAPEVPEKPEAGVPTPPKPPKVPHFRVPKNQPAPQATPQ